MFLTLFVMETYFEKVPSFKKDREEKWVKVEMEVKEKKSTKKNERLIKKQTKKKKKKKKEGASSVSPHWFTTLLSDERRRGSLKFVYTRSVNDKLCTLNISSFSPTVAATQYHVTARRVDSGSTVLTSSTIFSLIRKICDKVFHRGNEVKIEVCGSQGNGTWKITDGRAPGSGCVGGHTSLTIP